LLLLMLPDDPGQGHVNAAEAIGGERGISQNWPGNEPAAREGFAR
jgi:hypothetical protein